MAALKEDKFTGNDTDTGFEDETSSCGNSPEPEKEKSQYCGDNEDSKCKDNLGFIPEEEIGDELQGYHDTSTASERSNSSLSNTSEISKTVSSDGQHCNTEKVTGNERTSRPGNLEPRVRRISHKTAYTWEILERNSVRDIRKIILKDVGHERIQTNAFVRLFKKKVRCL